MKLTFQYQAWNNKRKQVKTVLGMTRARAEALKKPLLRGTAVGISLGWRTRLLEALNHITKECTHEHELELSDGVFWCAGCGRIRDISGLEMLPGADNE